MELAAYMGDATSSAIDMDRVRGIRGRGDNPLKQTEFNKYGSYVGSYDAAQYVQGQLDRVGAEPTAPGPLEEDSVLLYGSEGLTTETLAHEFGHRKDRQDRPGGELSHAQHEFVYLRTAFRARSKEEWDDVVEGYAAYIEANPYQGGSEAYYNKVMDKVSEILQEKLKEHEDELIDEEAQAGFSRDSEAGGRGLLSTYQQKAEDMYAYRNRLRKHTND